MISMVSTTFAQNAKSVKPAATEKTTIKGLVMDKDGSGLSGVSIIYNTDQIAVTDSNGFFKFEIAKKPDTNIQVFFNKKGYKIVWQWVSLDQKEVLQVTLKEKE